MMKAKVNGQPYDEKAFTQRAQSAVVEVVRKQAENGIDVVTDGEQGKPVFRLRARAAGRLRAQGPSAALGKSGPRKWPPSQNTTNNTSAGA